MLLIFMGASCTGKSSAAERIRSERNLSVYSGKDYLRLSKNEVEARKKFNEMLHEASCSSGWADNSLIYIVTDRNDAEKLNLAEHAVFVHFTADASVVKERFSGRMNGNLPKPLELMLEKQLKNWENAESDLSLDTTVLKTEDITEKIISFCEKEMILR